MPTIHPTATIDGDCEIADDVVVGPQCVLTGPLRLGAGTRLIGHAYLQGPLTMGGRNVVYPYACLGFAPQHAKYDPNEPGLGTVIGDGNTFREHSTVHRAFTDEGPTTIGDDNMFMVSSHAGHDCQIASGCTFVNNAMIGGHVIVGDNVIVGGGTAVHQFCRIGRGAMLSGATALTKDLLPFCLLTALNICGSLNLVGMRRSSMPTEEIDAFRWAFRTIYRYGHSPRQCLEALRERHDEPPVAEYIEFIESSARGICSSRGSAARGTAAQKEPR